MSESFYWEGFPGSRIPVLLPPNVNEILHIKKPPGLLLLSEGCLLIHSPLSGHSKPFSCTHPLGCVTSVSHPQDGWVLAVLDTGNLVKISLAADTATPVPAQPHLASVATSPYHTAILDTQGRVFSKGVPPMVGTLNKCDKFEKIRFPTGQEVIQLVTGVDFTAALVRRREAGVISPATPDTNIVTALSLQRESCPLGLAVTTEGSHFHKEESVFKNVVPAIESESDNVPNERFDTEDAVTKENEVFVPQEVLTIKDLKPSDDVDGSDIMNLGTNELGNDLLSDDMKSITRSSEVIENVLNLKTRKIEQNYKDLADLGEPISDILASHDDKDDPYVADIDDQPVGIKSLIKLEDIFISTDKVLSNDDDELDGLDSSSLPQNVDTSFKKTEENARDDADTDSAKNCKRDSVSLDSVQVSSNPLSYVTDLGKSVWSNSMSLLSLSSHQSQSGTADSLEQQLGNSLEQLDLSGVVRHGEKSSSEPPTLRQDDTSPSMVWPDRRQSQSSGASSVGRREAESLERLCKEGGRLGSVQVFCWGVGRRGQLGQGDMLARNTPTMVEWTSGSRVVKVAAGSHHCLTLTDTGEVWGWGDNTQGQAVYTEQLAVVLSPGMVALQVGERGKDIACLGMGSVVLSDAGRVYVMGSVGGTSKARVQVVALSDLKLEQDLLPTAVWVSDDGLVMCCSKVDPVTQGVVRAEVTMLAQVGGVLSLLERMVSPKTASADQLNYSRVSPEVKSVRDSMLSFHQLLTYTVSCSTHCTSLPQSLHTGVYTHLPQVLGSLAQLHTAVSDCIAADSLLLDSYQQLLLPNIVQLLLTQFHLPQASIQGQAVLEQLLTLTLKLLTPYLASLMSVQVALGHSASPNLLENISFLTSSVRTLEKALVSADSTRLFWQSAGPRLAHLMVPSRRLVLDSRRQPITLQGHFSRHWLVLLSDVLIDVGYSTVTTHPLATVWLEVPSVVSSHPKYELVLSTPEDTLTLVAPDSGGRTVWVQAMQRCVVDTLARAREGDTRCKFGREKESFVAAPISRTASYTWSKGELKGCKYEGGWLQGKVHGRGKMEYNDGAVHTGLWRGGLRHGMGVWVGSDGSRMEGSWVRGRLEGRGKLVDSSGGVYEGNLVDGVSYGHGIRKEGRFMGNGASVYIGAWVKGVRHGYGVLEDIMVGEKYMGMWCEGAKQGRGCVVNSDGVYYEGNFSNNRLCGGGIMLFEDGARYEGDFAGAGEFNGRGTLVAGGKRLVGTFYGNYSESMKFNGEISSYVSDTPGPLEPDMKYTVDPDMKWVEVFNRWHSVVGGEHVWDKVAIAINQAKADGRELGASPHPGMDYLEMIPVAGQQPPLTRDHLEEVEKYLLLATSCPLHPLATLLTQLVEAFTASYGGVRSHPTLLPHAIRELSSISTRLYSLVRTLFPVLPRPDSSLWISSADSDGITVTSTSLLHPLLLPPLHPTIFMLYALKEAKPDSVYWERILRWNKHPDETLLIFLDVDPRLYQDTEPGTPQHRDRDKHFLSAINTLQQIKTMFTPKHKLEIVLAMFKAITGTSTTITWSMDTLLPVCMYVVVRARVLQLGAELAMLQDLMETYLFQGEQGIMLTTLLAAYHQMLRESVFIN